MRTRYLALWVMALVATGAAFVSYLALRFESVRLGYDLNKVGEEHKRLTEVKSLLSLEAQTLRERQRIHAIAERSLGMSTPDSAHVVIVRGKQQQAGGAR